MIARRGGGALETILDGVTGTFWSGGPEDLARAVLDFDDDGIDPRACVENAARFDTRHFKAGMMTEVQAAIDGRGGATTPSRRPLPSTRLVQRFVRPPSVQNATAPMSASDRWAMAGGEKL